MASLVPAVSTDRGHPTLTRFRRMWQMRPHAHSSIRARLAAALPLAAPAARAQDEGFSASSTVSWPKPGVPASATARSKQPSPGSARTGRVIELDRKPARVQTHLARITKPRSCPRRAYNSRGRTTAVSEPCWPTCSAGSPSTRWSSWASGAIESNFGSNKGNYRIVEALTTLAWEGRRASYFRKELMNALRILDSGDVSPGRATSAGPARWASRNSCPALT